MKTKTRSKIWAILGTIVMVLPLLLGLGSVKTTAAEGDQVTESTANSSTVDITLNKLKITQLPDPTVANNGYENPFDGSAEGLEGVTFQVVNITEKYWDAYKASTKEKATEKADDAAKKFSATAYDDAVNDTVTTVEEGKALFEKLPKLTEVEGVDRNSVYLFFEKPQDGVVESANLIAVLPFYQKNSTTVENENIQLYPKNVIEIHSIQLSKVGSSAQKTALDGAEFTVQKTDDAGAPVADGYVTGVNDLGVATFGKEADAETFTTKEGGTVDLSGLRDGSYVLNEVTPPIGYSKTGMAQLTFNIKDFNLVPEKGTGLIFEVDHSYDLGNPVNNKNVNQPDLDKDQKNTILIENLQNYGSFKFSKQEVDSHTALDGAKFIVTKANGDDSDYLMVNEAATVGYKYAWHSEVKDAANYSDYKQVELESGKDGVKGEFKLDGVKLGTYFLKETVAPADYALPAGNAAYFEFTVNDTADTKDDSLDVYNQPKGILPHTGGIGILVFVVVGAALVGGVAFYFIKRRQETEA